VTHNADPSNVRAAFRRVLKKAEQPNHFTPHGLRHTYASLLLAEGVDVYYVSDQFGHASIELMGIDLRGLAQAEAAGGTQHPGRRRRHDFKQRHVRFATTLQPWRYVPSKRDGNYRIFKMERAGVEPATR
jgi:hypothetical protein